MCRKSPFQKEFPHFKEQLLTVLRQQLMIQRDIERLAIGNSKT